MVRSSLIASACVALVALLTSSAGAVTVPFTEDFATNNSNWGKSPGAFTGADYVATGGPTGAGDGFISTAFTFAGGDLGQLVFRGQDNFNSSNDAFVGNWNGTVTALSFYIRQNSSIPLDVGVRLATSANFPAANWISQIDVQPNVWTKVTIPITDTPGPDVIYTPEGPITLASVINSLGNIQILSQRQTLPVGTVVTFDVDKVSIVPEPSSMVLAGFGLAAVGGLLVRRHRAAVSK
jgi:hypothetical protein